jgi:hypothetical protein
MGLADELRKLQDLREAGTLSEEEFAQAKAALLAHPPPEHSPWAGAVAGAVAVGQAAKTWVNLQILEFVVGLILAAIVLFALVLPRWKQSEERREQLRELFDHQRKDSFRRQGLY